MRKPLKPEEADGEPLKTKKSKTDGSMAVEISMKPAGSSKRSALDDDDAEKPTKKAKVIKVPSARSLPPSKTPAISKSDAEESTIKKPSPTMKKATKRKKERPPESDDELPKKPTFKRARFAEEPKLLYVLSQIRF